MGAPLMTVFDLAADQVRELSPGHVAVIKKNGALAETQFTAPLPRADHVDGLAEGCPDVVVVDPRRHHPHEDLPRPDRRRHLRPMG